MTRESLESEIDRIVDGYKDMSERGLSDYGLKQALLKTVDRYVEERELLARIDERILVDFEVEREAEATAKAQAFTTPEGLDGYKCAVRDVHLDNGDRRKLLESQSEALRQQVKGGES